MTARLNKPSRAERGAALIEFALAAPLLIAVLIGIVQIAQMTYAGAEIRGVVGDAARLVKTNSSMTESELQTYVTSRLNNTNSVTVSAPTLVSGTTASGAKFRTIGLTYTVDLNFIFFSVEPLTMTADRTVYVH